MTPAEYLRREDAAFYRNEYWNGEVRPRADASIHHAALTARIGRELYRALPRPEVSHFGTDIRLRLPCGVYVYTDGLITPSPPSVEPHLFPGQEGDSLLDALLVVEVLSEETAHIDRGEKLAAYRTIPSLRDYLLFSQDGPEVEHHFRPDGGGWEETTRSGAGATFALSAGGTPLSLRAIYAVLDDLAG